MKITCQREPLAAAFQLAASVAPARSPKEILQNVKVVTDGDVLTLMATDMEVGIKLNLSEGTEIQSAGAALLPLARTSAILRESADPQLTIETDDSGIRIKGGRSKFRLPGANPDEFPSVAGFDERAYHEIPNRLFREMVRRTVFATDVENSRYALGGVLLEMEGGEVRAVGTDGRRMARMEGKGEAFGEHHTNGATTIIPSRAVQLMARAVGQDDETVKIAAKLNNVLMQTSAASIYSRLVDGRYPNWRQVFPTRETATRIDMTVGPLFAALRQAAIVTDTESRGIDFTFEDGVLRLDANTAEIGESHIELPVPYNGKPVTLTMDYRFVTDFCKVLDSETNIVFEIESSNTPAVLTTEDGYAYVIMPMARER